MPQEEKNPFSILQQALDNTQPILINLRNNTKLIGILKAYDKHFNMILENVTEIGTEKRKSKNKEKQVVERKISKMFLRGDNVIFVVKQPV